MKKFFEKYDLVKLTLGIILIYVILTWLIPTVSFNTGEPVVGDYNRIGIFNFFEHGFGIIGYFVSSVILVFMIGAFYQFLSKIGSYQKLTDGIAKKIKGKELIFLLIISFVFAGLSSIFTEQMALFVFIPFIITICNKLNMDKVITFVSTFGAVLVGVIGSTIGMKIVAMNTSFFNLEVTDSVSIKIVMFVIAYLVYALSMILYMLKNKVSKKVEAMIYIALVDVLALCFLVFCKFAHHMIYFYVLLGISIAGLIAYIVYVLKFGKKEKVSKKSAKKSEKVIEIGKSDLFENKVENSDKSNRIPLIIVGILMIIVVILAYLPWTYVFNVDWFTKAYDWAMELNLFGKPVFSYILGGVTEFGSWSLLGIEVVLVLTMLVLKLCYSISFDELLDSFAEGFKKVGKIVVVMSLSYLILVLNYFFPIIPTILSELLGKSFNVFTTVLSGLLSGLFNGEYQFVLNGVYANFSMLYPENLSTISVILQSTFGLMSFITPASVLLFVGLSYTDVKYKDWFKFIWKFLVIMLAVIVAIALIIK